MIVRYWQPWREMESLSRQIDQIFDELIGTTTPEPVWSPAIELKDAGDTLVLRVQLPGIDVNALDVQVAKQGVSISGEQHREQKTEEKGYFKSEFHYGKFRRVVPLPIAVENDNVQAEYKDGILTLTLPKVTEVRNKVVKINLTESQPVAEMTGTDETTQPIEDAWADPSHS
ncbi:Hsp20/alpha crystallin family protein [Thermocoleostomius sinensis]|uniref:Hsp20/alpha crystallin family protein n=1 Tax=Thermocoleostomius sinensis A174 TaxID=2016057 RepID=A0A9E9CBX9_9CYAN|nr:Hsp20/alpha crystallin family protein [Thermocoleostomius sinensis]WAL61445.1 Hsp20/alpha crystallin family protein [Thermocoleostomius sinensis A174]